MVKHQTVKVHVTHDADIISSLYSNNINSWKYLRDRKGFLPNEMSYLFRSSFFMIMTLALSVRFIIAWLGAAKLPTSNQFVYASATLTIILQIVPAYMYLLWYPPSRLMPSFSRIRIILQNVLVFGFTANESISLIMRTYQKGCVTNQLIGSLNCNRYVLSGDIPFDSVLLVLFMPTIMSCKYQYQCD